MPNLNNIPINLPAGMPIRLDIGSGTKDEAKDKGVGWIMVDPFVPDSQLKNFMWDLPFEDNSVDELFSSHTLEHCPKRMVPITLDEWYRVLKNQGKLTLRVPDLVWCCEHWLKNQTTSWDMDIIFGNQSRQGEFHMTGFTKKIGIDYLTASKFTVVKFEELDTHSQKTLSFECVKEALY